MRLAYLILTLVPAVAVASLSMSTPLYSSPQSNCDGAARLQVETPEGFCLAVIADGFKFPRSVAALPGGTFLVADMGGWTPSRGTIWLVEPDASESKSPTISRYSKKPLLTKVDRPAHIMAGPDGYIYFGTTADIRRFKWGFSTPKPNRSSGKPGKPENAVIESEVVIKDLPATGRHPLKVFAFDSSGGIFVNIGSDSDNCETDQKKSLCSEAESGGRGVIRHYPRDAASGRYSSFTTYAQGLRNSMAMVWTKDRLLVAENSRDDIEKADPRLDGDLLPPDEINTVSRGKHYGWPYCYGDRKNSPEFPAYKCSATISPFSELPAHSAPLGMVQYEGAMFPQAYRGKLIVALHGYRATGHRVIAVDPAEGKVIGDIVRQWTKKEAGAQGAPVGMSVAPDGAVLIADDKNKRLLRLSYVGDRVAVRSNPLPVIAPRPGISPGLAAIAPKVPECTPLPANASAGQRVQAQIFDQVCFACHGAADQTPSGNDRGHAGRLAFVPCDYEKNLAMLTSTGPDGLKWVVPGSERGPLLDRINADRSGLPQMPPSGLSPELRIQMNQWVRSLKP